MAGSHLYSTSSVRARGGERRQAPSRRQNGGCNTYEICPALAVLVTPKFSKLLLHLSTRICHTEVGHLFRCKGSSPTGCARSVRSLCNSTQSQCKKRNYRGPPHAEKLKTTVTVVLKSNSLRLAVKDDEMGCSRQPSALGTPLQ
jgi:hypothetical protein